MHLMSAHMRHCFEKLQLDRKLNKGMDIYPVEETCNIIKYQQAFLKYVENKYGAKHEPLPVIKPKYILLDNFFFCTKVAKSGVSSHNLYDLSSNDEGCLVTENVANTTPGQTNHAAPLLTAARLCLNSWSELPLNWAPNDPNHNEYHSDCREHSRIFLSPDITDWWHQ